MHLPGHSFYIISQLTAPHALILCLFFPQTTQKTENQKGQHANSHRGPEQGQIQLLEEHIAGPDHIIVFQDLLRRCVQHLSVPGNVINRRNPVQRLFTPGSK